MPEPLQCPHCGAYAALLAKQDPRADAAAEAPPALATTGRQDNWKFYLLGTGFALVGLLALGHALGDVAGQDWSDLADTLVPSMCGFCPLGLLGLVLLLALTRDGARPRARTGPRRAPAASDSGTQAQRDQYHCAACGARFSGPGAAPRPPGPGRPP